MKNVNQKPMFDFTETYLRKNEVSQLKSLRKFKDSPSIRKELSVSTNGRSVIFKLAPDGEYYHKGIPLTSQLELMAKIGHSKVSIQ